MLVSVLVALDAKSYEIPSRAITQTAPRLNVMDLKIFHAPTPLATPAISLQNFLAKPAIIFRIKPQPWPSGTDLCQSVTCTCSKRCFRCGIGRPMTSRVMQGNKASRLPASKLAPARKSAQVISKQ
jgi:hypothetical protein